MTLVDSSVWIDLFADRETRQVDRLRRMISARERVVVGDVVIAEVLQGARNERAAAAMEADLALFDIVRVVDPVSAAAAARHYRRLRALGFTPRKTIDTLIATRCILDNTPLLFADRDFHPFVEHLKLRSALDDTELN